MKRVIICGASSGIGRAAAIALSKESCELVLAARRRPLLDELAAQCQANGATAIGVPCDITQYSECEELIKTARELKSNPSALQHSNTSTSVEPVLVNSAGVAEFCAFADTEVAAIDNQIRTNLTGPMYACRAFLPWALSSGNGRIVNVLSISATTVFAGSAAYSASKAGLLMFGKSLAAEYRKAGLSVTSIIPGATDTAIWDSQGFVPPREDMLHSEAVGEIIRDVIMAPGDRNIDELVIMPPKGIL